MMTSNNALIPDPDKEDILASSPSDWPFLHLGLRMCGWADTQTKYYLLGTPIIWWAGSTSLIVAVIAVTIYILRQQRKYKDFDPGGFVSSLIVYSYSHLYYFTDEWEHFTYVGKVALVGWAFHYLPFLIMGRVTYIHHYVGIFYTCCKTNELNFMFDSYLRSISPS